MISVLAKASNSKLDDAVFMLRTWLRAIYSSFRELSACSETSALARAKFYKAQLMSPQFFSITPSHHTQRT